MIRLLLFPKSDRTHNDKRARLDGMALVLFRRDKIDKTSRYCDFGFGYRGEQTISFYFDINQSAAFKGDLI